jgi:hypothetical protein
MFQLKIKIHNDYDYCVICNQKIMNDNYENLESNNKNVRLNCSHNVHYHCLCSINDNKCPLCYRNIDLNHSKKFNINKFFKFWY